MNNISSFLIFGIGCLLLGFIIGVLVYGGSWSFNTFAGQVYGLIGGLGTALIVIGIYLKKKSSRNFQK